jgi:hypothetical protein
MSDTGSDADLQEQSQPVDPPEEPDRPHLGAEVPEADAIEQAIPVPTDDEYDRG